MTTHVVTWPRDRVHFVCSITTSTDSYDNGFAFVGNIEALAEIGSIIGEILPCWHKYWEYISKLEWKYIDSLPELQQSYDDSAWIIANHNTTNNTVALLKTPVSLYSSDYGFHTGSLLYRGHFVANSLEKSFNIQTQGGTAYRTSV